MLIYNKIKEILDKKIPFKISEGDTSYRKLNHILMTNIDRRYIDDVLVDYVGCEDVEDGRYIVHYYNKKHDIYIDLIERYICVFAEPDKSHFKVGGYKIYKGKQEL